ncbi:MAG: DUF5689 domain-containing protein [Saprospiraceae bacterium]
MKYFSNSFLLILLSFLVFNSCIEEDFDQPPATGSDPGLTVTTTIAELVAMHTLGGGATEIKEDLVIKGVVVADDFSGNWYRSFVIQDETAGITVLIDLTESYFYYPIGREVYIKLNGLALDDYNNLVQLGKNNLVTGAVDGISNAGDYLVRSVLKGSPEPKLKTITQLTLNDVNTLIQLDDVFFVDTFGTYADAVGQNSLNVDLSNCDGNTVIVRSSGFADFAGTRVARGQGTFIGVLSIFRSDFQFLIRNLDDLDMNGARCGGGTGGTGCNGVTVPTVTGVDEDFQSGNNNDPVAINGWTNAIIKGSRSWQFKDFQGNVYAQATAFNDNSPEMETWLVTPLIQISDQAKVLTFETAKAFYTHAGLTAWLSTDFECDPTLAVWTPLTATLAGQSDNDNDWVASGDIDLSALIGQKVAIGFKYVGSGTGGQTGTFRVDNLKLGTGGGNTGGNDPCTNGNGPLEVSTLNVDFSNGANNDPVVETGWVNLAAVGTRNWIYKEFSGNVYVQATAFNDTAPETASWLVTPLINATASTTLKFETAKAFWTHDGLTVWTSTDYSCDPLSATWTPLNATIAGQNDPDHDWIPSGTIDLSGFAGSKVAIGFKYEGNNNAGLTASYRVDNVIVQ